VTTDVGERLEALGTSVVAPLVLGGPITPVRPIGARLALQFDVDFRPSEVELWSRVGVARVRRARLVAPVDTLPELSPEEWALAAAFNDLLQVSNDELSGLFTSGRHADLLSNMHALLQHLPLPRTVHEAIARHATFARVFEVVRKDVIVSWWSGNERFRGRTPHSRLLAWPKLRGVRVAREQVALCDMTHGIDEALLYAKAWQAWVAHSPLTDLSTAARIQPEFCWSEGTLSLVSTGAGRTVALRALTRQPRDLVLSCLERANKLLSADAVDESTLVEDLTEELRRGFERSC